MIRSGRSGVRLGVITRGSLVEGLEMKLDSSQNVEDLKAGKFVVIEGELISIDRWVIPERARGSVGTD